MAEFDGVPVLFAPTAGPTRAGLMFRVGRADETLATGGITHLVEHLALHRHGTADYHYNGITSATNTQFVIQGTADAVVRFLNDVCVSLRELPISRLATEKKIIDTEAASRPTPVDHQMPLWRHGARDFGLASYPEWGLHTLTAEQVTDWAVTRFNRGNAVLWIAGEQIPEGLKLDLPDGERWDLPTESSAIPVLPAYFTSDSPMIVMDARVPRIVPATAYVRGLERALFRELRQNRGLSYTAATAYSADGRRDATVTATADTQPDQVDRVLEFFLAELRKLEDRDLDPAELEAIRTLELEALRNPESEAALLPRRATDLLTGFPGRTTAELLRDLQETTAGDIRTIAHIVNRSALLMVPHGLVRPPVGFEAAPTFSRYSVAGRRYRSRADHRVALIYGSDGLSLTTPQGPATVSFDTCAAMLRWPDGARQLFGADGTSLRIEPALFPITLSTLSQIDNAVSPAAIVDLPPRGPSRIPHNSRLAAAPARVRAIALPWRARIERVVAFQGGLKSFLLAAGLGVMTMTTAVLAFAPDRSGLGVVAVICAGILVWRRCNLEHW